MRHRGFERGSEDAEITRRLQGGLANRGPDGASARDVGRYALVQTWLAVIDLSDRVRYPLRNEAGTVQLVFNGEIYDYRALKNDLVRRGHRFETDCDAEVVVHAFEEWDLDAFRRLNGMFSLAIHDERNGRLVLARDRFGIKPLVYTTEGRFAFASDAMSLVGAGLVDREIDPAAISELATFHFLRPPATGLVGVTQLRPGAVGVREGDGSWSTQSFVEPLIEGHLKGSDALEAAGAAIDAAVGRQLVADVEVGLLLSSGIDSALLLDAAVRAGARPRAFTIAFAGAGDYDESTRAAELAALYGAPHEIENFDTGSVDAVEDVADAYDQPFADSSAIATLQLARLARGACTVVLSGTGADELFGGYYRLRAHKMRRSLSVVQPLAARLGPRGSRGDERASLTRRFASYAERLARSDSSDDDAQYLSLVGSATSPGGLALLRRATEPASERARLRREWAEDPDRERYGRLRRLQQIELAAYLPGDCAYQGGSGIHGRGPRGPGAVARRGCGGCCLLDRTG